MTTTKAPVHDSKALPVILAIPSMTEKTALTLIRLCLLFPLRDWRVLLARIGPTRPTLCSRATCCLSATER